MRKVVSSAVLIPAAAALFAAGLATTPASALLAQSDAPPAQGDHPGMKTRMDGPRGGHDAMMAPPLHGAGSPADVAAGTYAIEPDHTQVAFSVSHMGISPFAGMFCDASGTMVLDPSDLSKTKLTVTLPVASIQTTSTKLTDELKGADWLDAAQFPTATFVADSVKPMGPRMAMISGTLTLHGVSKPAMIGARFFGTATNPMSHKPSVGFIGRMVIRRSEFGVTKYVPMVSDETVLIINAAFEKQ